MRFVILNLVSCLFSSVKAVAQLSSWPGSSLFSKLRHRSSLCKIQTSLGWCTDDDTWRGHPTGFEISATVFSQWLGSVSVWLKLTQTHRQSPTRLQMSETQIPRNVYEIIPSTGEKLNSSSVTVCHWLGERKNHKAGHREYRLTTGRGLLWQWGVQITAQHLHWWGWCSGFTGPFVGVSYWLVLVLTACPDYPITLKRPAYSMSPVLCIHFVLVMLTVWLHGWKCQTVSFFFCVWNVWNVRTTVGWTAMKSGTDIHVLLEMNWNNFGHPDFSFSAIIRLTKFELDEYFGSWANTCIINSFPISLSCTSMLTL